ncbi:hypothetical protein [Rhizobium ruizarguesonis]|uniref:hypothetical protein n=1 Tax=Rhizobium ruizarguesonis TaxID=2081791 RepID=UPI0014454BC4|nr:hypothetical protein [Rhizobium ruizarguesonis]
MAFRKEKFIDEDIRNARAGPVDSASLRPLAEAPAAEYRIHGGRWINALMADDSGALDYPDLVLLDNEELGSLAPITRAIRIETGLAVRASRVEDGTVRLLHPDFRARPSPRVNSRS